jgi:hypothetical protein
MSNEQFELSEGDSYEKELIDKDFEGILKPQIESLMNFDESIEACAGLRWQIHSGIEENAIYTIDNLISIIDQAPESIEEDTDQDAYSRSLAIKILNDTYNSEIYKSYPAIEEKVLDSMLQRRLKLDKKVKYSGFNNKDNKYQTDEYYALRDFLNKALTEKKNNPKLQEKIFECFVNGTSLKDYSVILPEIDHINYMLEDAFQHGDKPGLLNRYIDILVDREQNLDLNDNYDLTAKSFMPYIYKRVFSNLRYNPETKKEITDKLLPIIFNTIKDCPCESSRVGHLYLLDILNKQPVFSDEEKYISQQIDIDAKIVNALVEVILEPLKETKDTTSNNIPKFVAQKILIDMLERYSKGVIYEKEKDLMAEKDYKHRTEYVRAFKISTRHLHENPILKRELLSKYDNFLNLDLLSEPTHPFYHLGRQFIREYYKEE